MEYSFRQLRDGKIEEIPSTSGIYWVIMPLDFSMDYLEETEGRKYGKKGRKMSYEVNKLREWGEHYQKYKQEEGILYIGKAKNLQNRIRQYYEFGYNDEKYHVHEGGRAIWQLRNNKELLIRYQECDNEEKVETELIDKYILEYGVRPYANRKRGLKKYRLF